MSAKQLQELAEKLQAHAEDIAGSSTAGIEQVQVWLATPLPSPKGRKKARWAFCDGSSVLWAVTFATVH